MTIKLQHGVFIAGHHLLGENPTLALERDLRLVQWLDELGFQEAWIGEHHSGGMEIIDSPELFIAAAAERTEHIRLGTGVVSLPYHHPLNVANRIVQLDHMTRGRIMFGAGPGLLVSDATMMGIDPVATRDRLAESLDAILRLLQGETVTEATDWYTLDNARVHLLPFSDPHPPVCVASAVTPSGGRLAGKHGLGLLCVAANDDQAFDALDTNWEIACDVAAKSGRQMDRRQLRLVMPMHLARSPEQARDEIRYGCAEYVAYTNNDKDRWMVPPGVDPADWVADNNVAVIGTPDDAIERIEKLLGKQGEFGVMLIQVLPWADTDATRRSMELYAHHVMPHFADANRNRLASFSWISENRTDFVTRRGQAVEAMFRKHAAETQGEQHS
jgi:limonene 1,2-monooxygenase